MKKIKVLMIGNHQSVKGGITSVIQQLLSFDWDSVGVEMKFIPTYIEASGIKKIAYFIRAYMNIEKEMRRNKPDIVHIHMSYRGSFYRKYAIHKLCKKYGVPDVIHLHGSEFQKWYNESDDRTKEKIRTLLRESASLLFWEKNGTRLSTILNRKQKQLLSAIQFPFQIIPLVGMKKDFNFCSLVF